MNGTILPDSEQSARVCQIAGLGFEANTPTGDGWFGDQGPCQKHHLEKSVPSSTDST